MEIQDVLRILQNGAEKPKDDLNDYMKGKRDGEVQAYSHAWTLVKNLSLSGVGSSNKADYKQGFELAKEYIDESSCDHDIYKTQLEAWDKYQLWLKHNKLT